MRESAWGALTALLWRAVNAGDRLEKLAIWAESHTLKGVSSEAYLLDVADKGRET